MNPHSGPSSPARNQHTRPASTSPHAADHRPGTTLHPGHLPRGPARVPRTCAGSSPPDAYPAHPTTATDPSSTSSNPAAAPAARSEHPVRPVPKQAAPPARPDEPGATPPSREHPQATEVAATPRTYPPTTSPQVTPPVKQSRPCGRQNRLRIAPLQHRMLLSMALCGLSLEKRCASSWILKPPHSSKRIQRG